MNMMESPGSRNPALPPEQSDRPGRAPDLAVSFEFFPPRQTDQVPPFWDCVTDLAALAPRFISVTYGAGGSTRDQTRELVTAIQARCAVPAAAHLTCVGGSRAEIDAIAEDYWQAGIHRLVALRGDPHGGIAARYQPRDDGYAYADQLVTGLMRLHPFDISVAAYPEVHPQAPSAAADLDHLKRKVDAGATRAVTQFFFDVDCYKRFLDRATRAGVQVPIIPGILPIRNFPKTVAMAEACGTRIPEWIKVRFAELADDAAGRQHFALDLAAGQCRDLLRAGVRHFHFYTLNQADLVRDVCAGMGVISPFLGYR
jgi:methylenetetrahydrofolate reductase (NADPH)